MARAGKFDIDPNRRHLIAIRDSPAASTRSRRRAAGRQLARSRSSTGGPRARERGPAGHEFSARPGPAQIQSRPSPALLAGRLAGWLTRTWSESARPGSLPGRLRVGFAHSGGKNGPGPLPCMPSSGQRSQRVARLPGRARTSRVRVRMLLSRPSLCVRVCVVRHTNTNCLLVMRAA
ncbi:Hypothetical predicted protein [Olea europaea subsp. europaea]|uniref:Uncharacterized protein n=1 Tax=Olea europaea subsp. europaea TaxID=158383 RepID=A0A8S0TSE3_OLEEU|nr:Hypothetical predicted protein [Olea europaea subsp. europaea]